MDLRETGVPGQRQHLGRAKGTEEGRPGRSRGFLDRLLWSALLGIKKFQRQYERHGQRGARGERRDLAQRGRDRILGQI